MLTKSKCERNEDVQSLFRSNEKLGSGSGKTNKPLPPCPIPLDCPSALALSALFYASNLDWSSISHMVCAQLLSCV